jgi:hypothetical protein
VSDAWRKILQKCASSDEIKKDVLFFGLSNEIGSGSVWRRSDDKSLRLLFELADMFPSADARASMIAPGRTAVCGGTASSDWSLKLGLPFSTLLTRVPIDINAVLSRAKSVTVSVTGYSIEALKETNWKRAVSLLDKSDPYLVDLSAPDSLIAENVVQVSGLKAVFTFDRKIDVDVKAQFKNAPIPVAQAPAPTSTDVARGQSAATSAPASSPPGGSAGRGGPPAKDSATPATSTTPPASDAPGRGGQTTAKATPDKPSDPCAVSPVSSSQASDAGVSTLHADVTSDTQITVCAAGPFYMLAAYSRVRTVRPIGLGNGDDSALVLEHVSLPGSTTVTRGTKPAGR